MLVLVYLGTVLLNQTSIPEPIWTLQALSSFFDCTCKLVKKGSPRGTSALLVGPTLVRIKLWTS